MVSNRVGDRPTVVFRSSIVAIWLGVIVFIVVLFLVLQFVVLRGFRQLERQNTVENTNRALNAIAEQTADLNAKASDWAAWDDAYEFVQNRNQRFIQSNFVLSAFTGIGLNLIAYIDASDEVVYGRWYEPGTHNLTPVPQGVLRAIFRNGVLLRHPDETHTYSGLIMLDRGPMLVSSRPVVTSNEEGPIRGSLIFGELLDSEEVRRLSRITRVEMAVVRLGGNHLPADFEQARAEISESGRVFVTPLSRNVVAGYTILGDIHGEPALMLRIQRPRSIYNRGLALSNYTLAMLVVLGLLLASVVSLLIARSARREQEYDLKTREFYRRTIQAATDGKLVVTDRDEICATAGEPIASWELSRPEEISIIRHEMEQVARESGMDEKERVDYFVLAAGEALTNVIKHAGGGRATMHRLPDGLMFVAADQGPGIPSLALPDVALTRGYSTAGTLGMGYKFMISITDCVFLATGPGGTTVGLVMDFHPQQTTPEIPMLGAMLSMEQGEHDPNAHERRIGR